MKKTRNTIPIDVVLMLYELDNGSLYGLAKLLTSIADTRRKKAKVQKADFNSTPTPLIQE